MEQVRERTLEVLDEIELDPEDPLLADGFVYEMLLAHEHQHNETMLQLLQMVEAYEPVEIDRRPRCRGGRRGPRDGPGRGRISRDRGAGRWVSRTTTSGPATGSSSSPSWIDRTPVTNADYIAYLEETGAEPPMYWERDGEGGWVRDSDGAVPQEVDPRLPVIHVSWHEADAFARWAGKRLPTRAGVGGGRSRQQSRARQPRPALLRLRARGRVRGRRLRVRRGADAGRRLGVDQLRLHRLPGLRGLSLPRVLRGLLRRRRTRSCAAGRGRRVAT